MELGLVKKQNDKYGLFKQAKKNSALRSNYSNDSIQTHFS